ncbi:MAG: alpha/beta hydrolase [Chloroflexaceae bacterium]|nr:alpha/beta hydrolase [Chloroflexaceae bacterium]
MPVLFVFGQYDRLVGNSEVARSRVQDVPQAQAVVVDASHLMAAERPDLINPLMIDFCQHLK